MSPLLRTALAASALTAAAVSAQTPQPAALASQETNDGVTAEVTEFKRRGNTLTAKVRYRNDGSEAVTLDVAYSNTYVLDAAGGKKYEILRDDQKNYIAAMGSSYADRYWGSLEPGKPKLVWIKFPAPPPEVKSATLQLDDAPPFDDLPIQD